MCFGIAAAIGNTIAAGIVAAQGYIAAQLPNVWLFLGVWILGGLYALLGASSLAELGAAIPRSGGQYNYSRHALRSEERRVGKGVDIGGRRETKNKRITHDGRETE